MKKRKCPKCNIEKELNSENFHKAKIKGKPDFHRYCKPCRKSTRRDGYAYLSKEDKIKRNIIIREFQKNTPSGRAMVLLKTYRQTDRKRGRYFNLTKQWILDNIIDKPCFYCGDTYRTGCERLDNNLGHTIENCVPCCAVCNSVRSNIFTVLEMKELGEKIKELKLRRDIKKINGNIRQHLTN